MDLLHEHCKAMVISARYGFFGINKRGYPYWASKKRRKDIMALITALRIPRVIC
jgi:hypothetical protein